MPEHPSSLLNDSVIADLLSVADDQEARAQLQDIFRSFLADGQQELGELGAGDDLAARRARLHRLKGMMGNYGFAQCADLIARWEAEVATADFHARQREVLDVFRLSRAALVCRYPWLD